MLLMSSQFFMLHDKPKKTVNTLFTLCVIPHSLYNNTKIAQFSECHVARPPDKILNWLINWLIYYKHYDGFKFMCIFMHIKLLAKQRPVIYSIIYC